ncbi:4-hydroxybenzoate octaprenyltransferase [Candidatus Pelagibacter communis]|uniref:4-hydroxybenzoate octaprenyltransferase n=1 Tax=Pelagibacter ubique TaxID=198252 RepID=UPI00094D4C3D|nr:4-hydroxybenzoate octaprenyltransferase [Candidatus Pelagibacter ubique]|tara:strand:- start:4908 stop:5768 length:861 start_codon:yes stop_codon:yes gene_type:complete
MNQINLFIELTRLKKPIGYMLLFWPCVWGITIAFDISNLIAYLNYLILFFSGAVLMRSAGCIVNDIVDRKIDKDVLRTKDRPVASGKISITLALIYAVILCLIAFLVLIQFNRLTILLALVSMPLAFTYPLMKRYTYWPQLFLGITFNYGLILGWTSITNEINVIPIIFYLGAIFWTLGYDTIYGFQDIKDDEVIGVKSTSIKFKSNPYLFLKLCFLIFTISLILVGFLLNLNILYYIFLLFIIIHMYYFQIHKLDINNSENCLKIFKSNNFLGFIVFLSLLLGKI